MFGLGQTELLVIAGIIVILFGGKRLPELGAGIGKAIANFKDSYNSKKNEEKDDENKLS